MTSFRASDWTGTIVEFWKQDRSVENMVFRCQRMLVIINGVLIHSSNQFGVSNIDVWTIQSNIWAIFGLRKRGDNPLTLPSESATAEYRNERHISIWLVVFQWKWNVPRYLHISMFECTVFKYPIPVVQ